MTHNPNENKINILRTTICNVQASMLNLIKEQVSIKISGWILFYTDYIILPTIHMSNKKLIRQDLTELIFRES